MSLILYKLKFGREGFSKRYSPVYLYLCYLVANFPNQELSDKDKELIRQYIAMENYIEKAEENLLELQEKKVKAQKSLFRIELLWIAIAILLAPVHLVINYYYPNNSGTGVGLLLAIIGIIMFIIYFFRYYEIKLK